MRRRYSIEKQSGQKQEKKYQQDCRDIVFKFDDELLQQDDAVYLNRKEGQTLVIKPLNQKRNMVETQRHIQYLKDCLKPRQI